MTAMPREVQAEYRGGHRTQLKFSDGAEATVNFTRWLRGPVFDPLMDETYFQRFFLDGGTVVWRNGAYIAPETLHEQVLSQGAA